MVEEKVFVSPSGEELLIILAIFEARANPGQYAVATEEARLEGLEVGMFSISLLPESMILNDRQKLDLAIQSQS
jgi:hypothetical protein